MIGMMRMSVGQSVSRGVEDGEKSLQMGKTSRWGNFVVMIFTNDKPIQTEMRDQDKVSQGRR